MHHASGLKGLVLALRYQCLCEQGVSSPTRGHVSMCIFAWGECVCVCVAVVGTTRGGGGWFD